jgi:hypothetical protein
LRRPEACSDGDADCDGLLPACLPAENLCSGGNVSKLLASLDEMATVKTEGGLPA